MDINSSIDFQEDPMVISCLYPTSQLNNGYKTPESSSRGGVGYIDDLTESHQRLAHQGQGNIQKRTNKNFSHFSTSAAPAVMPSNQGNPLTQLNIGGLTQNNYNNVTTTNPGVPAPTSPQMLPHLSHVKQGLNHQVRQMDSLTNFRGQLRSNATMGSPRNAQGNALLARKKKANKTKISFFSTIKWKKLALKWMSHTSFARFKKLTQHQFQLINDKASSLFIRKFSSLTHSTTIDESGDENNNNNNCQQTGIPPPQIRSINVNLIEMIVNLKQLEWCDLELKWLPVFSPMGSFRFAWDLVSLVVIVAFMFMIPIAISFDSSLQEMFNQGLLRACNTILIVDIVLNWNFGYFEKGLPIMKRSQIIRNYLFNGFLIDVSSCTVLAVDVFFLSSVASNYLHLIFFLKISSINGIFKKIEERFHLTPKVTQISSLIQLLFLIVTVTHLFACMWVAVSRSEQQRGETFWLQKMNFNDEDWLAQYVCSYYFSTVTMITVGYGDFSPVNNTERVVGILAMLISCVVFAYSLNAIGEIFSLIASKRKQLQADLFLINNLMMKKNINEQLQYEVREFLEYSWQMASDRNPEQEAIILNQLNPQLKEKLLAETYSMVLRGYKTFRENFSEAFVSSLTDIIEESTFRPDQWMATYDNETKFSDDLFFLESGKAVICEEDNQEKVIHQLGIGESFGDISFFSGQPYELHVKAVEYSTVLRIRRHRFIALISTYPHDYEIFRNIQDKILYTGDYSAINIRCFSCSSNLHAYRQCKYIHYVPETLPIIKRFVRSEWSNREIMQRRGFRFPTLLMQVMTVDSMMRFELAQCDAIAQYIDEHLNVNQEEEEGQDDDDDDEEEDDGCFESDDCIQEEDEGEHSKSTTNRVGSADILQVNGVSPSNAGANLNSGISNIKRESITDHLSSSNKDVSLNINNNMNNNNQFLSLIDPTNQLSLSQLKSKVFVSQHSLTNQVQPNQQQHIQQNTDNSISSKVVGGQKTNQTLTNIPEFDHLDSIRIKSPNARASVSGSSSAAGQFIQVIPASSSSTGSNTNSSNIIHGNSFQRKKQTRTSLVLQPSIRRYEIQPTSQKTQTILEGDSSQEISDGRFDSLRGRDLFGIQMSSNMQLLSSNKSRFKQIVTDIAQVILEQSQQANEKQQPQQGYQAKAEVQFDEQRNYDFYLPQNNLSEILSFLRFKRRMIKSMKASARQSMAVVGNTNFAIASDIYIKSTFQIAQQQPGQQQQQQPPISNYSLLRKFEQQNNIKQAGQQIKKQEKLRRNSTSVTPFTSRFQKLIVKLGESEVVDKDENDSVANYGANQAVNLTQQHQSFLKAESALENVITKRIVESEKLLEENQRVKPSPFSNLRNGMMNSEKKNVSGGAISGNYAGGDSESMPRNTVSLTSVEQKLPISKCFRQYEEYLKRKKQFFAIQKGDSMMMIATNRIVGNPMISQAVAVEDIDIATSREVLKQQDLNNNINNEDELSSHSSSYSRHLQPSQNNVMKSSHQYVVDDQTKEHQLFGQFNRKQSTSISIQNK